MRIWIILSPLLLFGCFSDFFGDKIDVDEEREIVEPFLDTLADGSPSGKTGFPKEFIGEDIVNDGFAEGTEYIIKYKYFRQGYGEWNGEHEVDWNKYYLETFYFFRNILKGWNPESTTVSSLYKDLTEKDQFTVYFDSVHAIPFLQAITTTKSSGSMGVFLSTVSSADTITIRYVVPGSPAESVGLKEEDRFISVNGVSIVTASGIDEDSIQVLFKNETRGDSGKVLDLEIYRVDTVLNFSLTKDVVSFPSVLVDTLEGVGHVQVFSFTGNTLDGYSTSKEFKEALAETRSLPITMIDLRNNGGGSVSEVLAMCDEVLASGNIIREVFRGLTSKGIPAFGEIMHTAKSGEGGEGGNYLLIANRNSASASEMFTACITEGIGVPFVGETTYGKGIGQIVVESPGKGVAKITSTQFYTGSGESYHEKGLVPTTSVDNSLILETALNEAKSIAGIGGAGKIGSQSKRRSRLRIRDFHLDDLPRNDDPPYQFHSHQKIQK